VITADISKPIFGGNLQVNMFEIDQAEVATSIERSLARVPMKR